MLRPVYVVRVVFDDVESSFKHTGKKIMPSIRILLVTTNRRSKQQETYSSSSHGKQQLLLLFFGMIVLVRFIS